LPGSDVGWPRRGALGGEAQAMFPQLPRWLPIALAVTAALALFALYRSMPPDLPDDCIEAGKAMEAEDYSLAIDRYFACLEADELPPAIQARVFLQLGNAYSAKQNYHQAIEDYGEALTLDPSLGWAYNNRCWSRGLLRQSTEALNDCNEALRLLPDQPEVLDSRALAYWQLSEEGKARADLARAHKLDPNLPSPEERFREFEEMFP
jgi:tetratricopeptide (TPR) repeat protein